MADDLLKTLSDQLTDAHTRIQQAHQYINPVVGVRRGMRDGGFPADVITVDCLRTQRRIVLILHDQHPGQLIYQFTVIDQEDDADFRQIPVTELSTDLLESWMKAHFDEKDG